MPENDTTQADTRTVGERIASRKVERITTENVESAFQYQPWTDEQQAAGELVRAALCVAAKVIIANVPDTPLRTRALNHLVDGRMIANAAITFRGQF